MPMTVRRDARAKHLGPALVLLLALCALPCAADADIALVAPGMNQTELQSVMGPPDYIQVNGLRQAWQYCPRRGLRALFARTFGHEEPLFVNVWFENGRVRHMRAYPGWTMGQCEDFLAAFSWQDEISGIGGIIPMK